MIEKKYRYTIPTPAELFEKFKERFSKLDLPTWKDSKAWTDVFLGIFDEIGRDFGYIPRREYLRLDETWEIRLRDISMIVLALEHENNGNVENILHDELQKLLDVKAFLKVLIFYPSLPVIVDGAGCIYPEIEEKIRSEKFKNPDEKYLFISCVYVTKQRIIESSGCVFDPGGKGENLESFKVNYT